MAPVRDSIEAFLGRTILFSLRGRDEKLFIKSSAFTSAPTSLLRVTCPECPDVGASPNAEEDGEVTKHPSLLMQHTPLSDNRFPELKWEWVKDKENDVLLTTPEPVSDATKDGAPEVVNQIQRDHAAVAEYLLVVEDPDAPLPSPVVHGIYYNIPSSKMSLHPADFAVRNVKTPSKPHENLLSGGFRYGANRMKSIWGGPRPVLDHGPHRYFFQVVALNSGIDGAKMGLTPTKADVEKEIMGKVIGWGVWIGSFERKLK